MRLKILHDVFLRDSPKRSAIWCPCLWRDLLRGGKQTWEKQTWWSNGICLTKTLRKNFVLNMNTSVRHKPPKKQVGALITGILCVWVCVCVCVCVLCSMVLHRHCVFYIEYLWQPRIKQVYWHHFPTAFANFMSVSHFRNSHSISSYDDICCGDQWSLMLLWQKACNLLKAQMLVSIFQY